MKRAATPKTLLLLIAFLALCLGAGTISAQEDNLLTNPGFELFSNLPGGGAVAEGWEPWNLPITNASPDYERVPQYSAAGQTADRVRSGNDAQVISTNLYFTYNAGIYQQVSGITPGSELRFSVYAWVWSSALDDREVSENPGDMIVYVGIDPTGGTDPGSAAIEWSPAAPDQYDAYRQYAVISVAETDTVTVYVWAQAGFPARNNYVYLDDAELALTPGSAVEPTDTPIPSNTPVPTADDIGIILPTDTPVPSATPLPTFTPVPTEEPEANTPVPTSTQLPTEKPATNTPVPTSMPEDPTPTREGTDVPVATESGGVVPTNTAVPTSTANIEFPGQVTYTVQRGDTVARIASLYGSTINQIIQANNLNDNALIFVGQELIIPVPIVVITSTPSVTPVVVTQPPEGTSPETFAGSNTYVVQAGDTLTRIALRFNTTVSALAFNNGITNPNLIRVGQQLVVPGAGDGTPTVTPTPEPRTYLVQPGDNLYRISLRFNVTMLEIAEANGILNANRLFAGQVLEIP